MSSRPLLCAARASLLAAPRAEALTDPSCGKLLGDLYAYLAAPLTTVDVLHMSNYQANGQWWGGYTRAELSRGWSSPRPGTVELTRARLVGSGIRLLSSRMVPVNPPAAVSRPLHDNRSAIPPELKAAARQIKEAHMQGWIDDEIPALGGLTPRQAAASPGSRAKLDLLLRDIEHYEVRLPSDERFDVGRQCVAFSL